MQNDTGSGLGELNFHVVDDEVFIRKLIIRVLGKMGADGSITNLIRNLLGTAEGGL